MNTGKIFESPVNLFKELQSIMEDPTDFGTLIISEVQELYNVSSSSYVSAVYPANGEITLYRNVTVPYDTNEVRVAWVVILSIFGVIFTVLAIVFIVKCLKKDGGEGENAQT